MPPQTMKQHLRRLKQTVYAGRRFQTSADVALALNAARWWAEKTGRKLPDALATAEAKYPELPSDVVAMQQSWLQAASMEDIKLYLPALASQFATSESPERLSSPSITDVAVTAALARTPRGTGILTFLDLAAGVGTMLLSATLRAADLGYTPRALAQDVNAEAALLASATMFIGGVESKVREGDSLITDPFADVAADIAVCQPPFGLNWIRQAPGVRRQHSSVGWYRWGLPQQSDSTWLFASRLIEKLRRPEDGGGRAVVFMAPRSLQGHRSDNGIRRAILEQDLVEAVIGLPGQLSPLTDLLLYALIFTNRKPETCRGRIQVVNLRPYFETSRDQNTAPRALSSDALDVLDNALRSVKPGIASRMVPVEYFIRRKVQVRSLQSAETPEMMPSERVPGWDVYVPGTESVDTYLTRRYGPARVSLAATDELYCPLEIDSLFDEILRRVAQWSADQKWPTTRLSALLVTSLGVRSDTDLPSDEPVVLLPTSTRSDAFMRRESKSPASIRTLELRPCVQLVVPDFLAGWLNSPLGRDCRRRAYDLTRSGTVISAVRTDMRSLMRYLDELVIPVPSMAVQQRVSTADSRLTAVSHMVDNSRRSLWSAPTVVSQVVGRYSSLFEKGLVTWANELPYPVASALWTLESKRFNVDAAHKQMFLIWEAYAAFTGTVLLSALSQDPVLRETEVPKLRGALLKAQLSMERATVGSWNVLVQRLSSCFRAMLQSEDADERARVLQMFGSPSHDILTRFLDTSAIQLMSDANAKRNLWEGHTGAVSEGEQQDHIDYLNGKLEELRDVVGVVWRELKCVRASDGFKRHGRVIQKVDLAVGPNTPFRQIEIGVGELMEKGELYLTTDGAPQPLPLQHLMLLRCSPDAARCACYFYNRLDGSNVRLVSYHLADQSELIENLDDVLTAVHDLVGS